MADTSDSPTKTLFDCLATLYKQGQMLLMDADRLMGEKGWEPLHSSAPAELSNALSSPDRWYARWAVRFYAPTTTERDVATIKRIVYISTHFASDHDTTVDEPLVSGGRLLYGKPMTWKEADNTYEYWMCKYWFKTKPHATLAGWHGGGQSRYFENLKETESFKVPLYDVTSSEKLDELVVRPLLSFEEET